jgi:FSR family fosmidomycin resistance protein-like MFS transporter
MTAVAGSPPARRLDVRSLLSLSWAHLLNDGAANYLPGVLPAVLVSLDEPVRMAGVLIAALTMGQALQPVTGWLSDRLGGRMLVVGGLTISSLGGGLLCVAHSTWLLIVLLLAIGVGNAMFHPQALAGVRSLVSGRGGLITSVFLVGGELGRGIWPTAASLVVAHLGLGYLWLVGLPGLATVPWLARVAPRVPARRVRGQRIRWRHHRRPMAVLVTYQSVRALATFALSTFIPIVWHLRGGSLVSGASIITVMLVVGVIGNLGGGHLADQFGRLSVLVSSSIATALLIIPIIYLQGAWLWVTAAPLGIALFLTMSPTILIGQDIFPENRSMGSGIALGLANGIGALLVLIIGQTVSDTNLVVPLWAIAGLSAASAPLAAAFPQHLTRRAAQPPPRTSDPTPTTTSGRSSLGAP